MGRTLEVLAFHERREDGRLRALTGNFIEVGLEASDGCRNRLMPVVVESATPGDTLARAA